jgi:hypothetical protein
LYACVEPIGGALADSAGSMAAPQRTRKHPGGHGTDDEFEQKWQLLLNLVQTVMFNQVRSSNSRPGVASSCQVRMHQAHAHYRHGSRAA